MNTDTDPILPKFSNINPNQMPEKLERLLNANLKKIDSLATTTNPTWDTVITPLNEIDVEFEKIWSPFSHLNNVCNTDEIRASYNDCIIKLSNYSTQVGQNVELYNTISTIQQTATNLDSAQQMCLNHSIRDFKLAGVALDSDDKQQYQQLAQQLAQLTTKFEENVMDSTQAWTKLITDKAQLAGLPEYAIQSAEQSAQQHHQDGYLLTLQIPSYMAVMQYADDRELRRQMYQAYCTRASDQGPNAGQFDNSDIMQQIISLRLNLAQLLDFSNFTEYSLATKMAPDTKTVLDFLWQLVDKSKTKASKEFNELTAFAKEELALETLEPWDIGYASEKLKQRDYAISDQELRPYFPTPKVIDGLFTIVNRLFGVEIKPIDKFDHWHDDILCYGLYRNNTLISVVYMDLYVRHQKRGGAWMDDAQNRYRTPTHELQIPIAFVTCNFNSPIGDQPALLSHNDVVTLFHEFGHSLQHMLTEVDCLDVAGINGVPWDAVEICSQFLENWAWQQECMPLISAHHETGEPLPDPLFERMQRARQFQGALQMLRQLEFSLFDFILHTEFNPEQPDQIQHILTHIRDKVSVTPVPDYNRFQHAFSHIFAGGYAAGYYSYKWAEVMSSDAFSLFLEKGIFDTHTSQAFHRTFLASGGAIDPMQLFVDFRGRKPTVEALLKQSGIA